MFKLVRAPLLICLLLSVAFPVFASDDEEQAKPTAQYVRLKPAFVANYGGSGRLRYVKVDVSLRVLSDLSADLIRMHMAPVRHVVVSLLSDQVEERVVTSVGKEEVRKKALEEINLFFKAETKEEDVVDDVLFNSFVVQQ